MVQSSSISITPSEHADRHRTGGADPLTGAVGIDLLDRFDAQTTGVSTALTTTYQNTEDHAVFVLVTLPDLTASAHFALLCDASSPPTTQIHKMYAGAAESVFLMCAVPPSYYYRVTRTAGAGTSGAITRSIWK